MDLVCIGKIIKSHGVRGLVKVDSYTEVPSSLIGYDPLFIGSDAKELKINLKSVNNNFLICSLSEVNTRDKSDLLRGKKIYTLRQSFSALDENDYYINDLIGLSVKSCEGDIVGKVLGIENFGAGDIVELKFAATDKIEMFSFTKENFPQVDVLNEFIVFNPPETCE